MSREPSRPVKAALTVASVLPFVVLQNFHPPCTLWLRFDAAAPKKLKEGSSSEFSPSPKLLAHHPPRFDALSKVIGCKPATANSRVSDDHFELKHRRPWSALVPVSSSWDEDSVASPPIARTGLASAAAVPFPGPVDRSIRIPPLTASCPGCDASTCAARGPKWAILRICPPMLSFSSRYQALLSLLATYQLPEFSPLLQSDRTTLFSHPQMQGAQMQDVPPTANLFGSHPIPLSFVPAFGDQSLGYLVPRYSLASARSRPSHQRASSFRQSLRDVRCPVTPLRSLLPCPQFGSAATPTWYDRIDTLDSPSRQGWRG
ncbi:hypothetical protein FB451DRAFT_1562178 [Mycena latifolia]|nr:hypothetical protein FB451DRAFT_1562178 [Mycena latifolia]